MRNERFWTGREKGRKMFVLSQDEQWANKKHSSELRALQFRKM